MAQFTLNEYADMHLMYGLASGNSSEARRLYTLRFPGRIIPHRRTFERTDRSLRETGSIIPRKGGEGQPRTARTPAVEQNVLDAVDGDPTTSVRKLSAQFNLSKTNVHNILQEQLLYPFHIQKVHAMDVEDYPARLAYARWFLDTQRNDNAFVGKVLFTDEAGFTRDGVINSHNLHLWADENPHGIVETKNQRRFCVNVWAGIVGNNLVGPYFFDNILNGQIYLEFLQNDFPPLLDDVPLQIRKDMWFMHDGAPPHYLIDVRNHLNNIFSNKWIGRGGPVPWPARSPEFNSMDSFFWGYLKSLVYSTPVQTRNEMVDRIRFHCNVIKQNQGMLYKVQRNILRRLRKCVEVQGGHIEHLL